MTQLPPDSDQPFSTPVGASAEAQRAARPSSVQLREADTGADPGMRMDAANRSLAEALRITFRLVQLAMLILIGLFILSGFRTIGESERGISVRFGKIVASNLEPGPHLTWPFPVGEMIAVGTGSVDMRIDRTFFPFVQPGDEDRAESDLGRSSQLNPARDGSLITADLNLAHAQWTITYRRPETDVRSYAETVLPSNEQALVRVASQRGIVRAVAEIGIDDLLKDRDTVASRARRIAQASLDEMGTGLRIEQFTLTRKFAPPLLREQFNQVPPAAKSAGQASETARSLSNTLLNSVAGRAAPLLISEIEAYERAVELGDQGEAADILARIDALLEGRPVEIDGEIVENLASGEVTQIIATARDTAFATVSDARADLGLYLAKREQYLANPSVMLAREWSAAYQSFLAQDFVQTFRLPSSSSAEIRINEDPSILRELETAQRRRANEEAADERERMRALERFRSQRGIQLEEDM